MSYLIILEGPDCCGKTQLAHNLARFFKATYFHATASPALFPALPDYHRNLMENVDINIELNNTVVLDRFWPSEIAYGVNLFRPDSDYAKTGHEMFLRTQKHKCIYIFCFSTNGWKRYSVGHTDPAHSLNREQYEKIWVSYANTYDYLQRLGVLTASYSIEENGDDHIKLATFLGTINDTLSRI